VTHEAQIPDEELVARILEGEESRYAEVVSRYQGRLLAHLTRLVGSRDDAADLVQEIFLRAFQALDRFNPEFKFSTWIFRIASNAGIDHLRKRRVRTISLEGPSRGAEEGAPVREFASLDLDPQAVLRNKQRRERIDAEIAALPPEFRDLIALRHFAGLSYEEIAQAKNMPLGTVKNKLFRARAVLKERLAGEFT
jgi:RNA polymerase sigma-70 factor (ECF subfamily)